MEEGSDNIVNGLVFVFRIHLNNLYPLLLKCSPGNNHVYGKAVHVIGYIALFHVIVATQPTGRAAHDRIIHTIFEALLIRLIVFQVVLLKRRPSIGKKHLDTIGSVDVQEPGVRRMIYMLRAEYPFIQCVISSHSRAVRHD